MQWYVAPKKPFEDVNLHLALHTTFAMFFFWCHQKLTLAAQCTKKLGSLFLALCAFFLAPFFHNLHPSSPYLQSFFAFIIVHSLAFANLNFFAFFELNSWAQFSCYCIPKGCFFSPLHKLLSIFNIPFHCEIVGDGYSFIVVSLMQFLLFCNCFCLILVLYYFLSSCCFTKICVCLFVHVFLSMRKL